MISVEPHPENYAVLVENVMLNKLTNVIALNVAAWDRECYLRLFIGDSAGHSVKRNYGSGYIVVRALPIDLIIKELNVRVVDFIKIDVEGAEFEVLKGLSNTLKEFKPKLIIEVSEENKDEVFKFLESYGYIAKAIHGLDNYYFFKPK